MPTRSDEESGKCLLESSTPTPLTPLKNPPLRSPRDCIRRFVRLSEREEEELERWITKIHSPRGIGWWITTTDNGSLAVIIEAVRTQRTPTPPRVRPPDTPEQDTMTEPSSEYRAARNARTARLPEPSRPSYATAQAVLAALPYEEAVTWKKKARAQLTGAQQADDHAVTILAAELADDRSA